MTVPTRLVPLGLALVGLALSLSGSPPLTGQEKAAPQGHAWTLEEALKQLRLYPRDSYLQYVAMQLARRENRAEAIGDNISRMNGDFRNPGGRTDQVDLFSMFSGALAVQESLQLDTMKGGADPRRRRQQNKVPIRDGDEKKALAEEARRRAEKVQVSTLTGPTIKSHPWNTMLAGKKPDLGRLAKHVPEDFYLVEFRSLVKLLEVMDQSDLWSTHLFNQSAREARTQLVGERVKKQLAIETTKILRPFYDTVVEEVGVTGSDLYFREGSDVTLLFRSRQPEILRTRMNSFLANAEKANPSARRTEGDYLGIAYVHVGTPDRSISVFSAYPTPELHVRSNSRVTFERILEAIQGKDVKGKTVRRLGDIDEFAYIRTLMPRGAKEEDGFVYLSDPFIRRLVGPTVKLTERRRMICYNHLRMMSHAALMYQTEHGKPPASLEELAKAGCCPGEFGKNGLTCPDGGKYTLSADGLAGVCSHHGHAHFLTPCCEIPVKEVIGDEADEYKEFLEDYNQYWRTFFDPIALRIQITPERYRMETIVLPLLDNTVYTTMARVLGGKPEPLDALPVPKRNIFSLALRLNKRELLSQIGMEDLLAEPKAKPKQDDREGERDNLKTANRFKVCGLAMHGYHDTYGSFPTHVSFDKDGKKTRLSWRVHVLPFLEEDALYKEFRLDEPWDSDHNKKLISRLPAVYQSANAKLTAAGKTRLVAPVGEQTMFPSKQNKGTRLADILDGTSNTIMLVEADDEHAVVWTKPDDLEIDLKMPLTGLAIRPPGIFIAVFADGRVEQIRQTIQPQALAPLFTRAGGEPVALRPEDTIEQRGGRNGGGFSLPPELMRSLKFGNFLAKGIGNQIGIHVYDSEPTFDFSLPSFFGQAMGTFGGRGIFGNESMLIGVLIAALNAPVYVSLPVQDPKIVDEFLTRVDEYLAVLARERDSIGGLFSIDQDFYRLPLGQGHNIRAYGVRFGPLKWRFFWGRIGNGLYIASKPFILEDLIAITNGKEKPSNPDSGPEAHGMVRIRPQNWDRVLTDYRLGWAENNREACLHNLGPLSSLSRSLTTKMPGRPADEMEQELRRLSARLFSVHFFCPEEGRYVVSPGGKEVTCSVHGSAMDPRQGRTPSDKSSLGKLLREFRDMTLALSFLEDGLRAVVTIDRK